jgi:hypothetical protein
VPIEKCNKEKCGEITEPIFCDKIIRSPHLEKNQLAVPKQGMFSQLFQWLKSQKSSAYQALVLFCNQLF